MVKNILEKIEEAKTVIKKKLGNLKPTIGLVLGSGLSVVADQIKEDRVEIPFKTIPYFPTTTMKEEEKKMKLVAGKISGKTVITMMYRVHFYEGLPIETITFPIRIMKAIGCTNLLLTNAAGGVNKSFKVGDFMLINDHINFSGTNPLVGPNFDSLGKRFVDCSDIYNKEIRNKIKKLDVAKGIKEGVYMMFSGPSYETKAEVRFARIIGADAVGMSTVTEALVGVHSQMKITGISLITNMAAGVLENTVLDHSEVLEVSKKRKPDFIKLVLKVIEIL